MEVTYSTEETAHLEPMDAVAEATTDADIIEALGKENQELLVEQAELGAELNREMISHAETTRRWNEAELALLTHHQLYAWDRFSDIYIQIDGEKLHTAVLAAKERFVAGLEREEARKLKSEECQTALDRLLAAKEAASFNAMLSDDSA